MIEPLPDLPPQVIGIVASGQVNASDYETVVIPAIESALKLHGRIRMLYQLGPAFRGFTSGAMWDDMKLGLAHIKAWERIAVVTDVEWVAGATRLFRVCHALCGQSIFQQRICRSGKLDCCGLN